MAAADLICDKAARETLQKKKPFQKKKPGSVKLRHPGADEGRSIGERTILHGRSAFSLTPSPPDHPG